MQPLEMVFRAAKQRLMRGLSDYVCVALDDIGMRADLGLETYLGSLLGERWYHNEPSVRLGKSWTRGGRLKRIGFLIMCERACRNES